MLHGALTARRARGHFVLNLAALFSVFARASSVDLRENSPSMDEAPKFNVQLLSGALRHPPPGSRAVIMTKKNGKRYRCHLPSTSTEDEQASGTPAATPPLASYLESIKGTCFYRLEGWWTYEFCYMKSLTQYHQEKVKDSTNVQVTQDYILGAWHDDSAGSANAATPSTYAVTPSVTRDEQLREDAKTRKKYWSQVYGNGTFCELMKRPRETEVRIQCSQGETSHISSIEEVATCKYVIHFSSNLLCRHPAFAAEDSKAEAHNIQCEPLGPDGQPLPVAKVTAAKAAASPDSMSGVGGGSSSSSSNEGGEAAGEGGQSQAARRALKAAALADPTQRNFDLGQCVLHMRYNYRGAIVSYDSSCAQSEAWMQANGVDELKHGRKQPFYHVLADTRDRPGAPVTYVAQELLDVDTPAEPLQHPLVPDYFERFDAGEGRFVPTAELQRSHGEVVPADLRAEALAAEAAETAAEAAAEAAVEEEAEEVEEAEERA